MGHKIFSQALPPLPWSAQMATKRALLIKKRPKTEKRKTSEAIYTTSHIPVKTLYTPDDVADLDYATELNDHGL